MKQFVSNGTSRGGEASQLDEIQLIDQVHDQYGVLVTESVDFDEYNDYTRITEVTLQVTDLASGASWYPNEFSYGFFNEPGLTGGLCDEYGAEIDLAECDEYGNCDEYGLCNGYAYEPRYYSTENRLLALDHNTTVTLLPYMFQEGGRYQVTVRYYTHFDPDFALEISSSSSSEDDWSSDTPLTIQLKGDGEVRPGSTLVATKTWELNIRQCVLPAYLLKAGMRQDNNRAKPTLVNETYEVGHDPFGTELSPSLVDEDGYIKAGLIGEDGKLKPGILDDERVRRFREGPTEEDLAQLLQDYINSQQSDGSD